MKPLAPMIKYILLLSCIFIISCTSDNKQQKAEKLVKSYLDTSLKSPGSYEAVSFGNVDTVFKRYTDTKQGDSVMKALAVANGRVKKIKDTLMDLITVSEYEYKNGLKRQMAYEADTGNLAKILRQSELLLKGAIKGWNIEHTYRAENNGGKLVTYQEEFELDTNLTKIEKTEEVK
jgi:hypothetical protein